MDFYQAQLIINCVFGVYVVVSFHNVRAKENTEHYVPCKPDWYYFDDKCYKIFGTGTSRKKTWTMGQDSCVIEGGNLASIHSNGLQDFLTAFFVLSSKKTVFIGLIRRAKYFREQKYSWIDGSIDNYTNWDEREPARRYFYDTVDQCAVMKYESFKDGLGKWGADDCHNFRPFICQVDKNDIIKSEDPRFCSIKDGGGWKLLNSCYHFIEEEESWEDAEKYCEEKYNGYLVSILDDDIELFLNYIMRLSVVSKNVWIGIKIGNYSMQKWASGWHVASKKFKLDDWHFVSGTCVVKSNSSSWGIALCSHKFSFFCEKLRYNVPVLQAPPSDAWECPHSGKEWLDLGGDSCYYVEKKHKRYWSNANYECGKKGGTLASILSQNESRLLQPHVLNTHERLLIGLRQHYYNQFVLEWADGADVNYTNWIVGEPSSKSEECVEIWTDSMQWNDVACSLSKFYICKTKKRFSMEKLKETFNQLCISTLPDEPTNTGAISAGMVVGIVFFTLLVGLLVGFIVLHYRKNWKNCTGKGNEGNTLADQSSIGAISEKVIWNRERK